ncbi:MAG: M20/M25/M40 family metallo-hydrolase [Bacteroidia bacterium]|nr:M20/M25/M40 family metallo-hydrolase [Bacteroidia bacterium]
MKHIIFFLFISQVAFAQKLKKADRAIADNLKSHVSYLAADKLEGRRAGTEGEKMAYEYISNEFKKCGLDAKGEGKSYLQSFQIDDGRQIMPGTYFFVNGNELKSGQDFFPFSTSPNSKVLEAAVSVSLSESNLPWFKDIGDALMNNQGNPHFDIKEHIRNEVKNAAAKGAIALILFNSSSVSDNIKFEPKDKSGTTAIPVVYLTPSAKEKFFKDESAAYDIKLKVELGDKKRQAHNVAGYINNNASTTVIIGAHYDHLGYGEDGNSMLRTGEKLIHNGADDNASGTAALIELAKMLKKSKLKNNNYLFLAFSGEELGLYGSKYFTENPTVELRSANYMINMDMVGRLNDSSKTVTISGFGTSPLWGEIIKPGKNSSFNIRIDSSGTGPSDHTSFYRKDIPVLFFFTGLHTDYHKPSDDADKINYTGELLIVKYIYSLLTEVDKRKNKLAFTKTREQQTTTSARFSVSMGIMPDYTFSGAGVRVDGVSDGRPAQKAGIKAGDVVTQLGDYKVTSVETYMQALGKFKKGDSANVKVKRGSEELFI